MKKNYIVKLISTFAMGLICLNTSDIAYAECVIDGQYNEWNEDNMDSMDSIFLSKLDMIVEDGYLCIYGKEKAVNPWESFFSYLTPIITVKSGKTLPVAIWSGTETENGQTLSLINTNGNVSIEGGEAIRTHNDSYEFELKIPIDYLGEIDTVSMMVNYTDRVDFVPTVKSTEPDSEEETSSKEEEAETPSVEEPTTKEEETTVENITSANSGIVIDGLFEDWKSYPHIFDTNWSMPYEQRNKDNCRTLSIYSDGEYLYMHILMLHGWADPFNPNFFNVFAAGEQIDFFVYTEDGRQLHEVQLGEGTHDLIVKYKNGTPGIPDNTTIDGSEVKLVRKDGKPDEVEMKIPLEIFEIVYGIDVEDIKQIEVKDPNIFREGMTVAGSSSAPYIGIIVCIASVLVGTLVYNKMKNKFGRES